MNSLRLIGLAAALVLCSVVFGSVVADSGLAAPSPAQTVLKAPCCPSDGLMPQALEPNLGDVLYENGVNRVVTVTVGVVADSSNLQNVDVRLGPATPKLSLRPGCGGVVSFDVPVGSSVQVISTAKAKLKFSVEINTI